MAAAVGGGGRLGRVEGPALVATGYFWPKIMALPLAAYFAATTLLCFLAAALAASLVCSSYTWRARIASAGSTSSAG